MSGDLWGNTLYERSSWNLDQVERLESSACVSSVKEKKKRELSER